MKLKTLRQRSKLKVLRLHLNNLLSFYKQNIYCQNGKIKIPHRRNPVGYFFDFVLRAIWDKFE